MRAKFIRGADPKKSLGIGRFAIFWGYVQDRIKEYFSSSKYQSSRIEFLISEDRNRMLINLISDNPSTNPLFDLFNAGFYHEMMDTIKKKDENLYIGINFDIDYSHYPDVPDHFSRCTEIYIQNIKYHES
jgi:hypothetical protein